MGDARMHGAAMGGGKEEAAVFLPTLDAYDKNVHPIFFEWKIEESLQPL